MMDHSHSAIYTGHLRHRRYGPQLHTFSYRLFMLYLDLDELPSLLVRPWFRRYARAGVIGFRRADYLGDPAEPLADAVRSAVVQQTGWRPSGPVRMLTHLRQFGYCFNPVTFYYCFDEAERLQALVAQVTNTPWSERHTYVLDAARNLGSLAKHRYRFHKAFHVSPFMSMEHEYDWRMTVPGRAIVFHMANHSGGGRVFDANLVLRRQALTHRVLARTVLRHPFMTANVTAAIYLQALRLWLKRTPFVAHPKHAPSPANG